MTSARNSESPAPARGRVIAIDGPAASGKSSVARELARLLNFVHVDTGAMYRAVTWLALDRGIPHDHPGPIEDLLDSIPFLVQMDDRRASFLLDGRDPSPHIREDPVNAAVSHVARLPGVRARLVALQRACARERDVVMEGRDIGSIVFPDTPFKFYIDASPEVRSNRRAAEGQRDQISARDHLDASRPTAPLVAAPDAVVIDSSQIDIPQVVTMITEALARRGIRPPASPGHG